MTFLQRNSLPDQVAQSLRQDIATMRWTHELPSEASLCRELRVSRMTLRLGLDQLAREGQIVLGGRGCHHHIANRATRPTRITGARRVVRVLCPYSPAALIMGSHVLLETVAEHLGSIGCHLEYLSRPAVFTRHSAKELSRLASLPDTAAWILLFAPASMQRWFAENQLPCLIIGRVAEGVDLPCVFVDTEAIGRHTAGLFLRRGHRELAYLIADFTSLGDRMCAEAFAGEARKLGARAQIITHPREPAGLVHALDSCFAARPWPTGILSTCPEHCVTTLCYLHKKGLGVPANVSLVAGLEDEILSFTLPRFACYRTDGTRMGRKTAEVLTSLIQRGPGKARSFRYLPKFIAGETLGHLTQPARTTRF